MGSVLRRLLFFFQRNQFDRDLEDELRFHEEMKAHALADADGMSGDEARAAARRRMGNPLRLREQSREPWSFATFEPFAQDVRHALRLIRRDPAFTFTAVATLARSLPASRIVVTEAEVEGAVPCRRLRQLDAVVGDIVNHPEPIAHAKAWIAATRRVPA